MMAALLLSVFTYIPIYKGMQQAAGNNVVTVSSVKDKVTGAIKLTPLTPDPGGGKLVPAKEAANANQPLLMLLVWIQVIYVCMIYGPIAAYLVEAFPAKVRYTSVSLPYHIGNGVFGGLLPLIGLGLMRLDRQYLCRALLSDGGRLPHVRGRHIPAPRDARHVDLG